MRIKFIVLMLIITSLACVANVSVVSPNPSPSPETTSTAMAGSPTLAVLPTFVATAEPTPDVIYKLHMVDSQNGWMLTNRSVLRTDDGGTSWQNVTPTDASVLAYANNAFFLDVNHSWILIMDKNDPMNAGMLYQTRDGGIHWSTNPVPFGTGQLYFLDDRNGWMMFKMGFQSSSMGVRFYQTTDGGLNWTRVYSNLLTNDPDATSDLPLNGIKSGFTPINMQEAWVTGEAPTANSLFLYHTVDGGHTWSALTHDLPFTGTASYSTYPPVFFDSQIGLLPTTAGSEGSSTFFFITRDGGKTWIPGAAVPGSGSTSVLSPNDAFVLFGNELSISHDGTQTWMTSNSNVNSNTIIQFQFIDVQTGWVVLSDANLCTSLYKTTDGGKTWIAQTP